MIHVTLGPSRPGPLDTDAQIYEAGRGDWVLGARADRETHALISHRGIVRLAIAIDHLEDAEGGRRAIVGRVLHAGDPVHDVYVGRPSPVTGVRNPITYFEPDEGPRLCRCGCGTELPPGKGLFVPGHDQRAVHDRVAKVGTIVDFLDWFDRVWPDAGARTVRDT